MDKVLIKTACIGCGVVSAVPVGEQRSRCEACEQIERLVTERRGLYNQFRRFTRYKLTRMEYRLFHYLGTDNNFLTVRQIKNKIWGRDWLLANDRISVVDLIKRVRRKLNPDYDIHRLKSGTGYMLKDMRDAH